jgi:hypothetical protein
MKDQPHLAHLELRLSHERVRLANARSSKERSLREVWVKQIEREIASELRLLSKNALDVDGLSDDQLLETFKAK